MNHYLDSTRSGSTHILTLRVQIYLRLEIQPSPHMFSTTKLLMSPFVLETCAVASADTYIDALDCSVTVFFTGVVDEGTLLFQQHLDAVHCPHSDMKTQDESVNKTVSHFLIDSDWWKPLTT